MAKGLRSKTRKYWASERRRLYGAPVEQKQIEEQTRKLKESLDKQASKSSILGLKGLFNPRGKPVVKEVEMEVEAPKPTKAVAMEVVKDKEDVKPKRGSRASRAKYGRRKEGGNTLPDKVMCEFK